MRCKGDGCNYFLFELGCVFPIPLLKIQISDVPVFSGVIISNYVVANEITKQKKNLHHVDLVTLFLKILNSSEIYIVKSDKKVEFFGKDDNRDEISLFNFQGKFSLAKIACFRWQIIS